MNKLITEEVLKRLKRGKANRLKLSSYHHQSNTDTGGKYTGLSHAREKLDEPSVADMIRTASRLPQAVLKITNYGKGKAHIIAHIQYITRKGTLALEDQDGQLILNHEEQHDLIDIWEATSFSQRKNSRDTLHLMLSSPPGTNRDDFKKAARSFLQNSFKQHDYVFVAHNDTAHPHVHVVINMKNEQNKKLRTSKATIFQLRQQFAASCREHGIWVEASPRTERGKIGRSEPSPIRQMKLKRNISPKKKRKAPYSEKVIEDFTKKQAKIIERYQRTARQCHNQQSLSKDPKQQQNHFKAAQCLTRHANQLKERISKTLSRSSRDKDFDITD